LSKRELLEKLQDPEYRSEFISSEIDVGLPMQIRAMREQREWSQSFVAEKTGTKQPRFSLMEKPGYGNFSLNTLKKLASLFDVGLIVSFVPWGEMISFVESLSRKRLSIASFDNDRKGLALAYSRKKQTTEAISSQLSLCFSTGSETSISHAVRATAATYEYVGKSEEPVQIPIELLAKAHLASINCIGRTNYVNASTA
jgi:transcriptional regulator with XRE-family HTH domain